VDMLHVSPGTLEKLLRTSNMMNTINRVHD